MSKDKDPNKGLIPSSKEADEQARKDGTWGIRPRGGGPTRGARNRGKGSQFPPGDLSRHPAGDPSRHP